MRWPWGWGRRPGAGDTGGDASGVPAPGPARSEPVPMSGRTSGPAAWSSLPPVQRSLGDVAPAVAPPDAFRSSLTTQQNPSFLAPLGHLVDPDGPSGVVGGLADAAPGQPLSYGGGPELRVPEAAPAKRPAPAVQRQIATLRPEPTSPTPDPPAAAVSAAGSLDAATEQAAPDPSATDVVSPAEPVSTVAEPLTVARRVDPGAIDPIGAGPVTTAPVRAEAIAPEPMDTEAIGSEPLGTGPMDSGSGGPDRAAVEPASPALGPSATSLPIQRLATDGGDEPAPERLPAVPEQPATADAMPTLGEPAAPITARSSTAASGAEPPAAPPVSAPTLPLTVPVQRSAAPGAEPRAGQTRTYAAPPRDPAAAAAGGSELLAGGERPTPTVRTLSGEAAHLTVSRSADPAGPADVLGNPAATGPAASPAGHDLIVARDPASAGSSGTPASPATAVQRLAPVSEPAPDAVADSTHPTTPDEAGADPGDAPAAPSSVIDHVEPPAGGADPAEPAGAGQAPDVVGLLAGRPPLVEMPETDGGADVSVVAGSEPLNVVHGRGSAETATVQRQFAEPLPGGTSNPLRSADLGSSSGSPVSAPTPGPASPAPVAPTLSAPDGMSTDPGIPGDSGSHQLELPGADAEYPPPVQRRSATGEQAGPPAEAPLSGFAAAITALQAESADDSAPMTGSPSPGPSALRGGPDLVVAREVADPGAVPAAHSPAALPFAASPAGRTVGRDGSAQRPELVVARRVAPDTSGRLPAADVRLGSPSRPTVVQRTLLNDRPALVQQAQSGWSSPTLPVPPAAPQVQRVRYEDRSAAPDSGSPADLAAPGHGWAGGDPIVTPAAFDAPAAFEPPAGHRGWTPPTPVRGPAIVQRSMPPATTPSAPSVTGPGPLSSSVTGVGPVAPAPTSWSSGPAAAPHPVAPAVQPSPAISSAPEPLVQLLADTGASQPPQVGSTTASSSRTVGFAEIFALVTGDGPAAEPGDLPLQRDIAAAPAPAAIEVQLADAAPASAPSASSAPAAPGGSAGGDIEEMARRLYEPLSARLRAELWQDRERAGLLTDLRP